MVGYLSRSPAAFAGLELEDRGEQGMYVNIPLTEDTVPDLAEQLAFLAKRQN
jgi:hypothetical protein